jgi:hypothetical protein
MVLLYQDPKGETVGTTLRMTANTTQTGSDTARTKVNLELESKVASLEKLITELRNENEILKVSDFHYCGALLALLKYIYIPVCMPWPPLIL